MNKLLALFLITFSLSVTAQTSIILPIIEVHDGDTIKSSFTLPVPLDKVSIRLYGIDTPEMPADSYATTGKLGRAQCVKEAELALKAKQFVVDIAKGHSTMTVSDFSYGKYAGRILGTVYINNIDVGKALIDNNLAVPYFGGPKTRSWCQ